VLGFFFSGSEDIELVFKRLDGSFNDASFFEGLVISSVQEFLSVVSVVLSGIFKGISNR